MPAEPAESPYDLELMAAVTELGSALRALVDVSVRTTVDPAELGAAAAQARAVTARLAVAQRPAHQLPALDDPVSLRRVFSPVTGVGSALAPPVEIREEDGAVVADAVLGPAYEGPPGFLHGGMSALLMDQLLGSAAICAGLWGMTVRLELDYRAPVPLETPLVLRARVTEDAGRRTVTTGTIALADVPEQVLVEARGVFVAPRPETLAGYFGGVTDASGRHRPPGRPTDATALSRRREPR